MAYYTTFQLRLRAWLTACADLPSVLITIFSFCHWQPQWGFKLMIKNSVKDMNELIEKRKEWIK